PVRHDAFRAGDALRDPLIPRSEAIRRESELAHAFRALNRLSDDFLLFEDRGPKARGGERPRGHSSGRSGAHYDRVVHSLMVRGSGLFRPYAVASAGHRTGRCPRWAVGRHTYGARPRGRAGPGWTGPG